MPYNRTCRRCGINFTCVHKTQDFHSRQCYADWCKEQRKCPDCGKERCPRHAREKTARWRKSASKGELKARSMQIAYRQNSGKQHSLSLDEARQLITNPPNCPYCELQIPWMDLSIDHKIPRSRGGSDDPDNLVWVDIDCNMVKGNLTDTEFIELCQLLRPHLRIKELLWSRLKASGFIYRRLSKG